MPWDATNRPHKLELSLIDGDGHPFSVPTPAGDQPLRFEVDFDVGTFGNRWDDPDGIFRVLYACSERVGAFVETLARFRPSAALIAGLEAIAGDDDTLPPGTVPASWRGDRTIGVARISGHFVDIGRAESLATLNHMLAGRLVHDRLRELDAAAIRSQAPRRLTQEISRLIYEQTTPDGQPAYAGI